jgi:hypothetical protein
MGRREQGSEDFNQRGFTSPIWTEQPEQLPRLYFQVNVLKGDQLFGLALFPLLIL